MFKPVKLTTESIAEKRYRDISEKENIYYYCSLSELNEGIPGDLFQRLFPNREYFATNPFSGGKGLIYKIPLFVRRSENIKVEIIEGANQLNNIPAYSEVDELDKELKKQANYLKEQSLILRNILAPWIIEWVTDIFDNFYDEYQANKDLKHVAETVNDLWSVMQIGLTPEQFEKRLNQNKYKSTGKYWGESIQRGYAYFHNKIKRSLEASQKIYLERMQLAYVRNYTEWVTETREKEHGNTKVSIDDLKEFFDSQATYLKAHTSRFIHSDKRWEGEPNKKQLAEYYLEKSEADIVRETIQKKLKKIEDHIQKLMT